MANFNTHISVSTIVSGMAATSIYALGGFSLPEVFVLWLVGSLSGILPDIDSDNSTALEIIFSLLSVVAVGINLYFFADQLPLIWLWGLLLGVFVTVRYGVLWIFAQFTVHRGSFHSVLGGLFFASIHAATALHLLGLSEKMSIYLGLFTLGGYLVHLILDELYSVDLANARIKRSFGTAVKPFSARYAKETFAMASSTLFLLSLLPWMKALPQAQSLWGVIRSAWF